MAWWSDIGAALAQGGANTTAPAYSGFDFDWGDALNLGASVVGNVLPAYLANEGANNAADAARAGNDAAIKLQRDIYQDQTARSEPWRQSGVNALNFLNLWNGLPTVSDKATGGPVGAGGQGYDSTGAPILPNYGAGQPVEGHSGGGGSNPLLAAAGSAAGSFFGGPVGGAIGGALGGLFRKGGDNWKTIATQAPAGYDYDAYFATDPGLAKEWSKADVRSLFNNNRDAYLYWQSQGMGGKYAPNGMLKPLATTAPTTPAAGATGTTPAASTNPDLWTTIKNNPLYVAATEGFLGIDKPAIEGAFSAGGQALSGPEKLALFKQGTARAGGALSSIYGNYADMAGIGASTASQQNQNAGAFGVNAGNMMANNGEINSNASAVKNANWAKAAGNALSGVYDYSKGKGWIN